MATAEYNRGRGERQAPHSDNSEDAPPPTTQFQTSSCIQACIQGTPPRLAGVRFLDLAVWGIVAPADSHIPKRSRVLRRDLHPLPLDRGADIALNGIADTTHAIDDMTQEIDETMYDQEIVTALDSLPHRNEAEYHSPINESKSGYLLETRLDLLSQLEHWATAEGQPCIPILSSAAGTGKLTVAFEFAKRLESTGRLGASFFFVRAGALTCTPSSSY
ncbi:hypothetical protein WOLCODRAFT_157872 [Wolfiporia cocos MD-104 SS10]|uniref:Uncharacterized protein n=1 Tax=Wolfiporia cocos (strain MD-104) TaxID=742152 RepID=A0A2H3JHG9_WOLCO|nr:hypothetical protein WOLCODRAFT_157872 [Wolfiporia cocos MD-104 SS10]